MRFLVDCCAGRRLAEWLRNEGHDVFDAGELEHDPGDSTILAQAAAEGRVLITLDNDFGELVFVGRASHAGVIRLPDLPVDQRITLTAEVIRDHREALARQALTHAAREMQERVELQFLTRVRIRSKSIAQFAKENPPLRRGSETVLDGHEARAI